MNSQCEVPVEASGTSYNVVNNSGSLEVFPVASKIRARRSTESSVTKDSNAISHPPTAYRIRFSIANKITYFKGCKQSIRWVFGLTNLAALREGNSGRTCCGEEHEVVLVWKMQKKKVSKLYWNKRNISNLFRQHELSGDADLLWKTCSGETIRIVARSDETTPALVQCDLLVDGTSFARLPKVSELGRVKEQPTVDQRSPKNEYGGMVLSDTLPDPFPDPTPLANYVGAPLTSSRLKPGTSSNRRDEIQDELHSELYTPVLEPLRLQITHWLPQTEGIVSRAIMNAFFVDLSIDSSDASFEDQFPDPYQVEADYVHGAYEWVGSNAHRNSEERALEFFQKRVDDIFARIRDEELSANEAARILLSVAAVLGLTFSDSTAPVNGIILKCLNEDVTEVDLLEALSFHGELEGVAIAKSSLFGFCRFVHNDSMDVLANAVRNNTFAVVGSKPVVVLLRENLSGEFNAGDLCQSVEQGQVGEDPCPPNAPVDSTPLLTVTSSLDDDAASESPNCVVLEADQPHVNGRKRISQVHLLQQSRGLAPATAD